MRSQTGTVKKLQTSRSKKTWTGSNTVSKKDDDMIHGLFGMYAAFTMSNETLDKCKSRHGRSI